MRYRVVEDHIRCIFSSVLCRQIPAENIIVEKVQRKTWQDGKQSGKLIKKYSDRKLFLTYYNI